MTEFQKTTISKDRTVYTYPFLGGCILSLSCLAWLIYAEHEDDVERLIAISVVSIFTGFLAYLSYMTKSVEFDQSNMYITGVNVEDRVPLGKIDRIEETTMHINDKYLWRITYPNRYGESKSVNILPKERAFEAFKQKVSKENMDVQIIKQQGLFG